MPIPAAFRDAMRRREFWIDYLLTEGAEWPGFGQRCLVEAPVGSGYEIVVALTELIYETNLYLRRPGSRKLYWMGRNDLANWPRDVLRWEETLLINEAAARTDPEFAASDVLLLLLCPFTPLTHEDDGKQIHARMRTAFSSLGVLSTSLINRCVRRSLSDLTEFVWSPHLKHGWVLKQNDTEHYEWPRSPDGTFPFKHFSELIKAAKHTCERRAQCAGGRRRLAPPLQPRPKPKPVGLPDGVFTRDMLKSARVIVAHGTPEAKRRSAKRRLKVSVKAALAALDAAPNAKAVVISKGIVTDVLNRMPAKRKRGIAK